MIRLRSRSAAKVKTMTERLDPLAYHAGNRPGKIEVVATKPLATQRDLSLAYTPGVAEACRAIQRDPRLAYQYTAKGNLVAVVTNGTAVLGLGNIGPLAGKPVMEGKANLFKKFADIDVFDIELDAHDRRRDRRRGQGDRADVRRHQPRGHQGAGVLRDRAAPAGDARHPGVPRRPARHRDHLRGRAAQRRRAHRAASSAT